MLETLLATEEGKTVEFKENTKSLLKIIKTIVGFANTAGGTIVIGVKDKSRDIVGLDDILLEEEKITNAVAEHVSPLLIPDIEIAAYRDKQLLIINVPHMVGPFYIKSGGLEKGVYVRLGSSTRVADIETLESLKLLAKHRSFDSLPCVGSTPNDLNHELIKHHFDAAKRPITQKHYVSLGIINHEHNHKCPTNAGMLLFAKDRLQWFPDSIIRCVAYKGNDRSTIYDHEDIETNLVDSIEPILLFIKKHINLRGEIGPITRNDIYDYPEIALRESVINALLHADYSQEGTSIQVAVFSNRIEIINPGALPFGQTFSSAKAGISKLRNKVIGRLFRRINIIEQLGSGISRVIKTYELQDAKPPLYQEFNSHLKVTLYPITEKIKPIEPWQIELIKALEKTPQLTTKEIAQIWSITTRTARTRLKEMLELGMIHRIATSEKDPHAVFVLKGYSIE